MLWRKPPTPSTWPVGLPKNLLIPPYLRPASVSQEQWDMILLRIALVMYFVSRFQGVSYPNITSRAGVERRIQAWSGLYSQINWLVVANYSRIAFTTLTGAMEGRRWALWTTDMHARTRLSHDYLQVPLHTIGG